MLVITRRIGEKVHAGGVTFLILSRANGSQYRIGVDAPPTVIVRRSELPVRCNCADRPFCELHGCKCGRGVHEQQVGEETRFWCPTCNATWTKKTC